jgi:hypothetical protein
VINGNLISLFNLSPGGHVKVVVHLDYALKGTYYPSLDDFGMIGYLFSAEVTSSYGDPLLPGDYLEGTSEHTATITTHQKKTTAIAGYVYNPNGDYLQGLTVELYLNGVLIATTSTDENGFYYFIDIEEGVYEVRVYYSDTNEIQVATASKNELTEVNFELPYYPE